MKSREKLPVGEKQVTFEWVKPRRVTENEAEQVSRSQTLKDPVHHAEKSRLHPRDGERLKDFEE